MYLLISWRQTRLAYWYTTQRPAECANIVVRDAIFGRCIRALWPTCTPHYAPLLRLDARRQWSFRERHGRQIQRNIISRQFLPLSLFLLFLDCIICVSKKKNGTRKQEGGEARSPWRVSKDIPVSNSSQFNVDQRADHHGAGRRLRKTELYLPSQPVRTILTRQVSFASVCLGEIINSSQYQAGFNNQYEMILHQENSSHFGSLAMRGPRGVLTAYRQTVVRRDGAAWGMNSGNSGLETVLCVSTIF